MKVAICCLAILVVLSNAQFNLQISKVLTPLVASDGFLILNTTGIKFKVLNQGSPSQFSLSIRNLESDNTESLNCYYLPFQPFENLQAKAAVIGCRVKNIKLGLYKVESLLKEISLVVGRYNVKVKPFTLSDTFEVTNGSEIYFHDSYYKEANFKVKNSKINIGFNLFESMTNRNFPIYLVDEKGFSIEVSCHLNEYKINEIECPLLSEDFPQEARIQKYNVYIQDSFGRKKLNHFVLPIYVTLLYLLY